MDSVSSYPVTDFHTHILPEMDSGSQSAEISRRMLEMQRTQGVQRVCLTPHYCPWVESPEAFAQRRAEALKKLLPSDLTLIAGAEVAFDTGISQLDGLEHLCMAGSNTMLLEMPYEDWTDDVLDEVLALRNERHIRVVLAHPERFLFSSSNAAMLEKLIDQGFPLQLNTETFTWWRTRQEGLHLLERCACPLLGSDSHDLSDRRPNLAAARRYLRFKRGRKFLNRIDQAAKDLLQAPE